MAGSRLGRALKLAALLAGSLVVAGLLAEGLVLLVEGPQVRFPRHVVEAPWGIRYNQPGATYRHRSGDGAWTFRINDQGMRADRTYAYEKPPGEVRVLSLGDSYTIGYEVDVDETFSAVLERELREAGLDAVVMNAGVSGFSTAEAAVYLERELLRYDPDLVVLSYYPNDLVDNVRTGLFALGDDARAVPADDRYVPAGGLGDMLNRSRVFNALSARSNAFALVKERVTLLVKRRIVAANQANLEGQAGGGEVGDEAPGGAAAADVEAGASDARAFQRRLAAALVRRMHDTLSARGVPFVVQSIPARVVEPAPRLVDGFPYDELTPPPPGLHFLPADTVLRPEFGRTLLYHERSHFHWTPAAHEASGRALARLILGRGLLRPGSGVGGGTD